MNAATHPTSHTPAPYTPATYTPATPAHVQAAVRDLPRLVPTGRGTKPSLLADAGDAARLDLRGLAGILEYDPGEYTFTAYAGTPLAAIAAALAEHGQSMPFDPPLLDAGATLGGTIAAGLSGSSRYRYGGLRDFILGVQIVDGQGRLIRGGGKVVKNAAGFDLPKLMVGSLGRLGIIISASFKVFPAPRATATLTATLPNLTAALQAQARLMVGPYDLEALDLLPDAQGALTLHVRIGGPAAVLPARLERLRHVIGVGEAQLDDRALWHTAQEFTWVAPTAYLIKLATTQQQLPALDAALHHAGATRRYAVGGNLAWIAWTGDPASLHSLLAAQGLRGLVLRGPTPVGPPVGPFVGAATPSPMLARITTALDPDNRFPALPA